MDRQREENFVLLFGAGLGLFFVVLLAMTMSPTTGRVATTTITASRNLAAYAEPHRPTFDSAMNITINTLGNGTDVVVYGGGINYNDTLNIAIYQHDSLMQSYNTTAQLVSSTSGVLARGVVFIRPVSGSITVNVTDETRNTYNTADLLV